MSAVRLLAGSASRSQSTVRAVLNATRAAADHPCSRELRRLLDAGFTVTDYQLALNPVSVSVWLRLGEDTCEVASTDLAFAAYVVRALPGGTHAGSRPHRQGPPTPSPDTDIPFGNLGPRAKASVWVGGRSGLAEAVSAWESDFVRPQASLQARAARLARPGLVPPLRMARHLAALQAGQLQWAVQQLPKDLARGLRPVRDPGGWIKQSVAFIIRDQLALLGPAAAEVARIIDESEGLAPSVIVEELRRRPVKVSPLSIGVVKRVIRRAFGDEVGGVVAGPLSVTPLSQLHRAELAGGTQVFVRVRRPGIPGTVRADSRISATMVAPFEWLLPGMRSAHPLGFVELAARQLLEEVDFRHDALNAVELGLVVEALDRPGVVVCRPVPDYITSGVAVIEALDGAVPLVRNEVHIDADAAVAGLIGVTLEAALTTGVFHADLRPEHLLALPDGRLGIVGCSTLGRLSPTIRRAGIDYLAAVLGADFEGQVAAMQTTGAVPDGVDIDALVADLAAAQALQPVTILAGGETSLLAALAEAMHLLLRHRLRPPLDVVLLVRTMFALRSLIAVVAPERSFFDVLLPLVVRLPELRATEGC